jgi:hypothetical protein
LHSVVVAQLTPKSGVEVPELSALQPAPFQERIVPPSPTALHSVVAGQLTP